MSDYGPNQYHFDGRSLPSLMREVCASPVVVFTGQPAPTVWDQVSYGARLFAAWALHKLMGWLAK
jgi:hypothetical protein